MENPSTTGENRDEYRDDKGRFLPGNMANPNGRPKGSISLVAMLRKKLEEIPEGDKKSYAEKIIDKLIKNAAAGDSKSIADIIDRTDGKPSQAVDVTSKGEQITGYQFEVIDKTEDVDNDSENTNIEGI